MQSLNNLAFENLFPVFDLANYDFRWLDNSLLSIDFINRYQVIPLNRTPHFLEIGLENPADQRIIDMVSFETGLYVKPFLIKTQQLKNFLTTHCNAHKHLQLNLLQQISLEETPLQIQDTTITYDEPLVKFVDNVILHAFQKSASDIHIEPYETHCRIRYREHGILREVTELPHAFATRLITRLKVMAKIDIAERRLPQDGRFQLQDLDIRINTCPTLFGEKVVLRLLHTAQLNLNIDELGFESSQQALFIKKISQPQGMILVTGPTGSGKTVTLYSALKYLNTPDKNISSVEDPIEIKLPGINQVNINPKIGLTFDHVLKTFLRQDPDVIMVGEIRDIQTADIAMQAAQTGHLVLSTLHTNSALDTLTRLLAMGIPAYHLTESISLIIAQRLLRVLCPHCKQPEWIQHMQVFKATGCQHCSQGYTKRIGIYEILPMTETISQLILTGANTKTILQTAKLITLQEIALEKVKQGITSFAEMHRVINESHHHE